MLNYLYIDNIAVIERAQIELDAGFTVLTGETGSGKSIVIDSIMAVLGEKTSKEIIRTGCEKALVSASFSNIPQKAIDILQNAGYEYEDELIIQRKLSKEGKNSVTINSQPATVTLLKSLGRLLINIHGQHDSQLLLNKENHLSFLDGFIGNDVIYKEYREAFNNYKLTLNSLKNIDIDEYEKNKKIDLLQFQIEEISSTQIEIGEISRLKEEITRLKNAEKISELINNSKSLINGANDSDFGVLQRLSELIKNSDKMAKLLNKNEKSIDYLTDAENALFSAMNHYEELENSLDFNEETFKNKQERLDLLNKIVVKYGGSEEKTLQFLDAAQKELSLIKFNDVSRIELEEKLQIEEENLINKGKKLTDLRNRYSKILEEKVCSELKFLDFLNAKFIVKIDNGRYTKNGCDDVEFLISANPGEEPKPLIKVASGGELSRIMLALRSILSLKEDANTLIFDEIDTGISGFAAGKISNKLKDISNKFQTICVTHLAQIASKADNHLLISKEIKNDKTFTNVELISGEKRIKEIARIISGEEVTQNVYNSAKEMLGV